MGKSEIHVFDKMRKPFVRWDEEGPDMAEFFREEQFVEARMSDKCAVCKSLQQQTRLWMVRFEIKCFHKEREQWGIEKLTKMNVKT